MDVTQGSNVKVLGAQTIKNFEDRVSGWIQDNPHVTVVDIKFSRLDGYYAMIVYHREV